MSSFDEARAMLEAAGQGHVLRFWSELNAEEKDAFLADLAQLESAELKRHCRDAAAAASRESGAEERRSSNVEPVEREFVGSVRRSQESLLQHWEQEGKLYNQERA